MRRKLLKSIRLGKVIVRWITDCCWCSVKESVTDMNAEACNIGRRNILEIKQIIES